MADANAALTAALALIGKQGGAPSNSVGAALTGSPMDAVTSVLGEAVKDTPTNQTATATSGGATRTNWSLGSGDFVITSRSSGSSTTGARSTAQDAGGSNGEAGAVAGMPVWGWFAIAGAGILALVFALRR